MKIDSPKFKNGKEIPTKYTADGENISPELVIAEIPKKTKSLVLVCSDPDAVKVCGFVWIHWIVFNINTENQGEIIFERGSIPEVSMQGKNSDGGIGYSGPSPPNGGGTHRYYFTAYALSDFLDLKEGCSSKQIEESMKNKIIEKSEFFGVYSRY